MPKRRDPRWRESDDRGLLAEGTSVGHGFMDLQNGGEVDLFNPRCSTEQVGEVAHTSTTSGLGESQRYLWACGTANGGVPKGTTRHLDAA